MAFSLAIMAAAMAFSAAASAAVTASLDEAKLSRFAACLSLVRSLKYFSTELILLVRCSSSVSSVQPFGLQISL